MKPGAFIGRLWVLMATVFVDMIGFLIILPLLPFYAEKLGADPLKVGALVSSFALAQLASAPLWGKLSDRYGRRPMILGGLLISAVAFVVFELAGSVWLLFVSRFIQGAASGTTPVVQAYVSDAVPAEDRAKALGWMTAATSAGVMIGPAIGSLSAAMGWVAPGFLAAGFCVLNFAFAWRWLPESVGTGEDGPEESKTDREKGGAQPRYSTRRALLHVLANPRSLVARLIFIYAFGMMAFMAMNGVFALYLERTFGVTVETIGWFFVFVGGVSLVMRALLLGPAVRRFGETRVVRMGTLSLAVGLAALPLARTIPELGLALLMIPIGTALLFPATTSMVSGHAPKGQIGMLLGVQQAFGGASRLIWIATLGPLANNPRTSHSNSTALTISPPFRDRFEVRYAARAWPMAFLASGDRAASSLSHASASLCMRWTSLLNLSLSTSSSRTYCRVYEAATPQLT